MHHKNSRLLISLGVFILLVGVIFFRGNFSDLGGKFAQSSTLTSNLNSTVCHTDDTNNNINIKGTVTFQNGSPDSPDTCQGSILLQTQCINKQNIGTTKTVCPNGCSDGICINASDNTLKGFTITMADAVALDTATGISISAINNDNSVDTTHNKQVIILVDGDPNATFPLTAQTLVNGTLSIDNALKFKKVGNVIVTVKDIETGTESSKNIVVTDGATVGQ